MTLRPHIAWFTSNDEHSRSWYLWSVIGPLLSEHFDITLFSQHTSRTVGTQSYLTAYQQHERTPFDLFLYNLEDRVDSYFSRFALGLIPGAVVFHDFLLHTDGPEPIHNSAWSTLQRCFVEGAAWPQRNTSHDRHGPWASRESSFALGGLFFSAWSHQEWMGKKRNGLIENRPSSAIWYPAIEGDTAVDGATDYKMPYVAFTGGPRVEDRATAVLRAIRERKTSLVWLLDSEEQAKARELIAEERVRNLVTIVEGRFPQRWQAIVSKAHAALHPRVSVFGDLGPYLELSLASGTPVVVTDFGKSSYLPDDTVIKITPGTRQEAELALSIGLLMQQPRGNNERALSFARECLSPRVVAGEVSAFISRMMPLSRSFMPQWQQYEARARADLLAESWEGWNFGDPLVRQGLGTAFNELFGA